MSRSKVRPASSAKAVSSLENKENSLFEPSILTESDDSAIETNNHEENRRHQILSVKRLRNLVQYNHKLLSPNASMQTNMPSLSSSDVSNIEEENDHKTTKASNIKQKTTKPTKIKSRGKIFEPTFSSRAKIAGSSNILLIRSDNVKPKKPSNKKSITKKDDTKRKNIKSKLLDEDSINLERSIKHLENGLSELNKKSNYRLSLSTVASDKRRISSGTVGSLSSIHSAPKRSRNSNTFRTSLSPESSPRSVDSDHKLSQKKLGLNSKRRLSMLHHKLDLIEKGSLSHVQSLDDRVLEIEKRLKVIDMEQNRAKKDQTRSRERLDAVEAEIGVQFKKQYEDVQALVETLEQVHKKQHDMSQHVKHYAQKQQGLDQVQIALETKLQHHHDKMREFTERLEELSIQSREISGNNHMLREQLRLISKSPAWSRTREAPAATLHETSADKIAAHKQVLRHYHETIEEKKKAARPPSSEKSNDATNISSNHGREHGSSEELYKRYKNLKHAYYRVFGSR
jgi:hypothetical protein